MKRFILIIFAILFISLLASLSQEFYAEEQVPAQWEQKSYVERGNYLVNHLGECLGCHTPRGRKGGLDMKLVLSGVPAKFAGRKGGPPHIAGFRGPRGSRYYSKNITPDRETGIGKWSEDQFVRALKTMTRPDGTKYDHSQMNWEIYMNMREEDMRAMYRYLKTIKPIKNKVPKNIPPK